MAGHPGKTKRSARVIRIALLIICLSTSVEGAQPATHGGGETMSQSLLHFTLNSTAYRIRAALSSLAGVAASTARTGIASAALKDCMELLGDSAELLSRSLASTKSSSDNAGSDDAQSWLSAALTGHDTCEQSLAEAGDAELSATVASHVAGQRDMVRRCLAAVAAGRRSGEQKGQQKRRLISSVTATAPFPSWVTKGDRRLLLTPAPAPSAMNVDMVVSPGGENGAYKNITAAIKAVPNYGDKRVVIYVKAGVYKEHVKLGTKKTNVMVVGDGKGKTIIAGGRSVGGNYTTYRSATFAATGSGLILRDLTVENWAGPAMHQAVALRLGADRAVVYRCSIIGYQDTLYVHSNRHFFRECDIYGTVDFIFGNAAVVLQSCILWARRPLPGQKNTITAQNRRDPNQNTGISIHGCRVMPAPDLASAGTTGIANYSTFLGRPWGTYARTVYMMSNIAGHVDRRGWLEWNGSYALDTLYYGEYMNTGEGAAVEGRVKWPGFKVITNASEAGKFTVNRFIYGSAWLPTTGVLFSAGLSV